LALLACLASGNLGWAQTGAPRDLADLSLEDLMNIQVTSVSKKEQKLSRAAAAVYVITAEDIRRSGATNIPDLLRLVPGVSVARLTGSSWAISIRGFADRFANKVLVLIDGRAVYDTTFSGVLWDQQTVPVENIERIEVIRGPGGTVWGANAVNGVINVITFSARDTQGGLLAAGGGSEPGVQALARYGGKIGRNSAYRVYGSHFSILGAPQPGGGRADDGWRDFQGGFRTDWELSPQDQLTVQGDAQGLKENQPYTAVISAALPQVATFTDRTRRITGNVLGRWDRVYPSGSQTSLQVYYDHLDTVLEGALYVGNTADLSFQHHLVSHSRHDIVWGFGARVASSSFRPGYSVFLAPPRKIDRLFGTFVQDEVSLTRALFLTFGSKLEHNDYTGFEFEPSAQLVWTPSPRQNLWLSAARAIRQPSRADAGVNYDLSIVPVPGVPFGVVRALGNPRLQAEKLNDFEAGYRAEVASGVSVDVAAFASFYRDVVTTEPGAPVLAQTPASPYLLLPTVFGNGARARSYGGEVSINWSANRRWRTSYSYSAAHTQADILSVNPLAGLTQDPGYTPEHQIQFRSFLSLPHNLEWDHTLAYVGRLADGSIPAYTRLDTRIGWRVGETMELSVTGANLLQPRHAEFPDQYGLHHTDAARRVYGKVLWRF
jgi:iron complex outermembrane recepter protein